MEAKLFYHPLNLSPLSDKRNKEVEAIYAEILKAPNTEELVTKMQKHYLPAYMHGKNVCKTMIKYGLMQRMPREKIIELATAGLLIDVGYLKIPVTLLNKKGGLSGQEFAEIKSHPKYGADILAEAGYSETIQKYVLDHHEAADGNGYMHKTLEDLQDGQIELHIADVYEAIQEDRAYRSGRDAMAAYQMVSYMCSSLEEFNALESIWATHMSYS